uniref:Uncharacterized protein n=1 Tax=Zea mays TaxID=4577 RepID=A0A804QIP6_MAIZE
MTFGSADMEAGGGGERRHGQQEEQSSDERRARFAEDWGCCACACAGLFLGPNPMVARYMYALIFLVTNLLAWTLRDYGDSALAELQRLKVCQGALYCLGAEGVLRVSLGCFVFFFVMFLSTVKARKVHDCRNSWHSEWWPAKLALWLGLTAVTFLAPSPLVQLYGGAFRSRGFPGDPADQRHQVHHVAQRLVPRRDDPEEIPLADSGGVHRHVRGVAPGDRAHVRVVRAQPGLQAQHPLHHRHAGARAAHDLRLHELQGEGRVRGAGADGDLRRVPVLVGDQKRAAHGGLQQEGRSRHERRLGEHRELCDRRRRHRGGDLLDGDRLQVPPVQAGGGGVGGGGGGRHPLRPRLLPPGVLHGRHVLRHDLRRLEREREPHHGEVDDRRRVGEHVGARRQRVAGGNRVHMDDDRARHLEDEAGGIGGGDVSSFSADSEFLTAGIYIYIQTQEQIKGTGNGKRWCVLTPMHRIPGCSLVNDDAALLQLG